MTKSDVIFKKFTQKKSHQPKAEFVQSFLSAFLFHFALCLGAVFLFVRWQASKSVLQLVAFLVTSRSLKEWAPHSRTQIPMETYTAK